MVANLATRPQGPLGVDVLRWPADEVASSLLVLILWNHMSRARLGKLLIQLISQLF